MYIINFTVGDPQEDYYNVSHGKHYLFITLYLAPLFNTIRFRPKNKRLKKDSFHFNHRRLSLLYNTWRQGDIVLLNKCYLLKQKQVKLISRFASNLYTDYRIEGETSLIQDMDLKHLKHFDSVQS